jgi:hypothetical protein
MTGWANRMKHNPCRWMSKWFVVAGLGMAILSSGKANAEGIDFEKEIAPLLSKHCLRCHNDSNREGDVSLATRDDLLGGGDRAVLLVPQHPEASLLIEVLRGDKPRMPQSGEPLSSRESELLTRWVAEGAEWPAGVRLQHDPLDWWSLRRLVRPEVPKLDQVAEQIGAQIRNPIDAFIVEQWAARGLRGNPEADRRTLIRRVYFDLIGLPPSMEEVERFCNDPDPAAYEQLVDELLDSPRYGERWARHWLDAVHYGDTHGYDKDKLRPNAWPYRDYVIRSLNEDKPYYRFVQEQLAGDHLFPGTRDGIEGLGMIAAGPFDFVGQIEVANGTLEKQRVKNIDRDDMVATVINTFVSMTAQCARCHDHKFDPIEQKDYYRLQAVFGAIDRADRPYDAEPDVAAKRLALTIQRKSLQEQIEIQQQLLREEGGEAWARIDQQIAAARQNTTADRPPEYGYHSQIVSQPDAVKWVQLDLGSSVELTRVGLAAPNDDFAGIGPGFGFPKRFRIEVSDDPDFRNDVQSIHHTAEEDYPNPGVVPVWWDGNAVRGRYVRVTATKLAERSNDYIFSLAELMAIDRHGLNVALGAKVSSFDSIEAPIRWRASNLVDGLYPGRTAVGSEAELAELLQRRDAIAKELLGQERWSALQGLREELLATDGQIARLPPMQWVYAAATDFSTSGSFEPTRGVPRPIHVLARGAENAPLERVSPGALTCIPDLMGDWNLATDMGEEHHRAALAEWITHRNNGLTWRSIVNRVWHHHFGRGIVETLNDFGRMGAEPTHSELLDWLACEFRDGRQSLKELHRWMLTSATYRQSSDHVAAHHAIDGGNQFLWRMHRRRLEAESIRDSVLQVSGKLRLESGGPGFHLFGLIDDHSPHYLYEQHDPDDIRSHRRTIYRFIVRSVPDPWMTTLDCADAAILVDRRNETLTALQALAMLNNRFMLRMSEHFAERVVSNVAADSSPIADSLIAQAQVEWAYRQSLQRSPTETEREVMLELMRKHGLVHVCRTLFNANEFMFVD